ncbi:hypothetical protein [Rhodococcus erythropolis]|uniref:hypothetical protein n=1 Tax=Rhodococcus erythropolis TaxID=1833 RepID=UPI0018A25047|nr:hypothetical protein [Rhodococcus erythropolis]MBF7737456.1 hypothetical protein [Rhodococcus erythropolis]MCZ4645246.1 hypothetical protein [Rhodococcus erythropolis]
MELPNVTETYAAGGSFSQEGRRAAVQQSLGLISLYFSADSLDSANQPAVSDDDSGSDFIREINGIRFRVALASARRLTAILRRLSKQASFKYELVKTEQVGSVTGQIDVNRWVSQFGSSSDVATYPVLEVRRGTLTPENILVFWACKWILEELEESEKQSAALAKSAESRSSRLLRREIQQTMRLPAFAVCGTSIRSLRSNTALRALIGSVERRARRREMMNPTPYVDLAVWVRESLDKRPSLSAGDVDWAFYDSRFDTRLFELWCLGELNRSLCKSLGVPEARVNPEWSGGGVTFSIEHFSGTIDLHFQRAVSTVAGVEGRWVHADGKKLLGIPDITVIVVPKFGEKTVVLIDPKLRQRPGFPGEETHKLLGYLDNYQLSPRRAALLIYSASDEIWHHKLVDSRSDGEFHAVRLNPSLPGKGTEGVDLVSNMIVRDLGLVPLETGDAPSPANSESGAELQAESHVQQVREQLLTLAASGRIQNSEEGKRVLEALLTTKRWNSLPEEARAILATAGSVGNTLGVHDDFSGPILGICSVVEGIFRKFIIEKALVHSDRKNLVMIGQVLDALENACDDGLHLSGRMKQIPRALRIFIDHEIPGELDALKILIPRWRAMNRTYRRPAAHYELMTHDQWQSAYHVFMVDKLLADTCDALVPAVELG